MLGVEESQKVTQSSHPCHFLGVVVILSLFTISLRSPGLDRPLLGNFSPKNVVYAMARNWAEGRADLWHP